MHESLGDTNMQSGETKAALREYRILTILEPENARHFENAAFAAHKVGFSTKAQSFALEAVRLDPTSAARSLVP